MFLPISVALAADVLVIGDSWAEGSADELQDALDRHGLTVMGYGISGTTADQYANVYPTAIPTAVAAHPEARWVWLSMGGNDLFANYAAGNGASNGARYEADFQTVLDQIEATRPDMRVVSFGYDFVNFEQSTECIATAWVYFGTGTLTPAINGYFLADIGDSLATIDPGRFRYTYVDSIWGTLQAAGGIPGAPDPNVPSPARYMADCIHPNGEGYGLIHDALVDAYWGVPVPVAAIEGPTWLCDEVGVWVDTSTGAVDRVWIADGVEVGSDPTLTWGFGGYDVHTLSLRVAAGAWEDEATIEVVLGDDCDDDTATPVDTSTTVDTGGTTDSGTSSTDSTGTTGDDSGVGDAPGGAVKSEGCACHSGNGAAGWEWLLGVAGLVRWIARRRR